MSNPAMRIGGLGSGMDVGGTIQQIMELESRRLNSLQEQQDKRNEKIGAWLDIKENLNPLSKAADTLRWMDVWRKLVSQSSNPMVATATAANISAKGTYDMEVIQLARAHTIASGSGLLTEEGDPVTASTKLVDIEDINVDDEFTIAGETFTITADDTLTTLRNKINAAAANMPDEDRVSASILDNRLVLQRVQTGDTTIDITDSTGSPLEKLGVLDGGGNPANELLEAQNAEFWVNGALVERSSNVGISDVLEGLSFNLHGAGFSQLSVGRDNGAIKSAIMEFVDAYNHAAEVNEAYGTIDRTDSSRPVPGLLYGDFMMRDMTTTFRRSATQLMTDTHTQENAAYEYLGREGIMRSLQDIGIWTEGETNRLAIVDEDRLDEMLERYPDEIENLFRGVPSETSPGVREGGIGLEMYRLTRYYTSGVDGWIDIRVENIDDEILRQDARIQREVDALEMKERMLWRQFGAMDEAIGKMQMGFERLMQQLGNTSRPS